MYYIIIIIQFIVIWAQASDRCDEEPQDSARAHQESLSPHRDSG